MFQIIEKIDKAVESQVRYRLINKMGKYYHGVVADTWARVSSGKMRGKIKFESEENGLLEIDVNDIMDLHEDLAKD